MILILWCGSFLSLSDLRSLIISALLLSSGCSCVWLMAWHSLATRLSSTMPNWWWVPEIICCKSSSCCLRNCLHWSCCSLRLMCSHNHACCVLSQCNTWLRLLYLSNIYICIYSTQPTRKSQISNCQGWQLNAGVTILCSVYIYSYVQSHLSILRPWIIALILSNSLVWSKPVMTGPAGNDAGIKQQFNTVI